MRIGSTASGCGWRRISMRRCPSPVYPATCRAKYTRSPTRNVSTGTWPSGVAMCVPERKHATVRAPAEVVNRRLLAGCDGQGLRAATGVVEGQRGAGDFARNYSFPGQFDHVAGGQAADGATECRGVVEDEGGRIVEGEVLAGRDRGGDLAGRAWVHQNGYVAGDCAAKRPLCSGIHHDRAEIDELRADVGNRAGGCGGGEFRRLLAFALPLTVPKNP